MSRPYGVQKVDLLQALAFIATNEGIGASGLVHRLMEGFNSSERTAKDALSVLRRSGCVTQLRHRDDGRRRSYFLTPKGWRCLTSPYGGLLLRFARLLFTTCASPRVKRRQRLLREQFGSLGAAFNEAEQSLLHHALAFRHTASRIPSVRKSEGGLPS